MNIRQQIYFTESFLPLLMMITKVCLLPIFIFTQADIAIASGRLPYTASLQKVPLTSVDNKRLPFPIALAISSLMPLAETRTKEGEVIKIYKIAEKYGECDEADVSMKADNCPKSSLLISTMLDYEGGSQFRLYKTPAHLNWLMPDPTLPDSLRVGAIKSPYEGTLLACEKFPTSNGKAYWKFVEYQLRITGFDRVELFRVPSSQSYSNCAWPQQ